MPRTNTCFPCTYHPRKGSTRRERSPTGRSCPHHWSAELICVLWPVLIFLSPSGGSIDQWNGNTAHSSKKITAREVAFLFIHFLGNFWNWWRFMTYRHAASKEIMRGKRQRQVNAFVPALTASCCPVIFPHFRIFHKSLGERAEDHSGTSGIHAAPNPAQSRVNYKVTAVRVLPSLVLKHPKDGGYTTSPGPTFCSVSRKRLRSSASR